MTCEQCGHESVQYEWFYTIRPEGKPKSVCVPCYKSFTGEFPKTLSQLNAERGRLKQRKGKVAFK